MIQLDDFIKQCELNQLDPQTVEIHLTNYRQNMQLFIDSLLGLSNNSVLAFIMLKNEVKANDDPFLSKYVLEEIFKELDLSAEEFNVPAQLLGEIVYITCRRMNEVPVFVVEHCKCERNLYLMSRILSLHCPSVRPLQDFVEQRIEALFAQNPIAAAESLLELENGALYKRYFSYLVYLLRAEGTLSVGVQVFASLVSEFESVIMQNKGDLVEIVYSSLHAHNIEPLGILVNSVFMTPALLEIVEECSTREQKEHIFDSAVKQLAAITHFECNFDNGAFLLLQGLEQFVRESYDIQLSRIEAIQTAFEHEINNVLTGGTQVELQVMAELFSSFPLDSKKYAAFGGQILNLLIQGVGFDEGRFELEHFCEGTVQALIAVLITLTKAHEPSAEMISSFFSMAALAPNEQLAVPFVSLMSTSVSQFDSKCDERFDKEFRQLCMNELPRLSNSPLFMGALSGLAEELLRRSDGTEMGFVVMNLVDFLLCRERLELALAGSVKVEDAEFEAYSLGFELMEAAVLSGTDKMILCVHDFVVGLIPAIQEGVRNGQFDYEVLECVLRLLDELSQIDPGFLVILKQLEPTLCELACQDNECSRYCCMIVGSHYGAIDQRNIEQLSEAALRILTDNIWSQSAVELAYFLQQTVRPESEFNEAVLELAISVITDSYMQGELVEEMSLIYIKLSKFMDIRDSYKLIFENFCLAVGEIVADQDSIILAVFLMYDEWELWGIPEYRRAFWETCTTINPITVENTKLRDYLIEFTNFMK